LYHSQVSTDPALRWKSTPAVLESLKKRAKDLGLWNLWLSGGEFQGLAGGQGGGLSNLEVSPIAVGSHRGIGMGLMVVRCNGGNYGLLSNNRSSGYKLFST